MLAWASPGSRYLASLSCGILAHHERTFKYSFKSYHLVCLFGASLVHVRFEMVDY